LSGGIFTVISALQDVERNQGTICVTFLDFENYFKTISLPALFLLLRKFGMNENDVQALESYYEHSHMRVVHADGEKEALTSERTQLDVPEKLAEGSIFWASLLFR